MKHLALFPMASKYCLGPVSNLFTGPVVPAEILRGSIFWNRSFYYIPLTHCKLYCLCLEINVYNKAAKVLASCLSI